MEKIVHQLVNKYKNMTNPADIWNQRYSQEEYAYGQLPNEFLKTQLPNFKPGKILFPADGEGRNSVYAASLGWQTDAFDLSHAGQAKALGLAQKNRVEINYQVGNFAELGYKINEFDAMAFIYAHFPAALKSQIHHHLCSYLRPAGIVIFEAFSKNHLQYNNLNPKVGGPKDLDMLFSLEEIRNDFSNFEIILLEEKVIELQEGLYHIGQGSVIRFVGRKSF
jgi:2-polyprenyl-3-methyl-5-hydroxy-6-metoxy-1,4-benzoquinol methylase